MYALLDQTQEPFVANEAEADIAKAAAEKLQAVAAAKQDISIAVQGTPNLIVPLPARAVQMILTMLLAMSKRTPFSVIPHDAELTTQQAADFLNVSRPYLTKLIDTGHIECRKVGRHRRVLVKNLRDFETRSRKARRAAIDDMVAEAKSLGLDE